MSVTEQLPTYSPNLNDETMTNGHQPKKRGRPPTKNLSSSQSSNVSLNPAIGGSDDSEIKESSELTPKEKKRLKGVQDQMYQLAMIVGMAGGGNAKSPLTKDANVIAGRAEPFATKWVLTCRQYPELEKATDKWLKSTPIAALFGEVLGIGVLIATNHGIKIPFLPANMQPAGAVSASN